MVMTFRANITIETTSSESRFLMLEGVIEQALEETDFIRTAKVVIETPLRTVPEEDAV